jgi:hypothetical protein
MKNYTLQLTEAQLNYLANALAKQPFIEVFELIGQIQQQVKLQEGAAIANPKSNENDPLLP